MLWKKDSYNKKKKTFINLNKLTKLYESKIEKQIFY